MNAPVTSIDQIKSTLIDLAIRFGARFKRPSKKTIRLYKAKQGAKLFTADEIR